MTPAAQKNGSIFPLACLLTAVAMAVVLTASGLGNRWGWWGFLIGLKILTFAAFAEAAVAVVSLGGCFIGARSSKGLVMLIAAVVIAVAVLSVPLRMASAAKRLPYIHDITTDTVNPPSFDDAIRKLRAGSPNSLDYAGPSVAEQQLKAYPYVKPLLLALPPGRAYEAALAAARALKWDIVGTDPSLGMIEATDTTLWFGFKDDIAVRITAADGGSRIDVRSVSRVGKSDIGKNAERIRRYLKELQALAS